MTKRVSHDWHSIVLPLVACLTLVGCFGFGHKKKPVPVGTQADPDKVLYERALDDIKHGRNTVGRLTLQTLINTYPDSDYLAKAKLAIADSYYKEGGTSGLTQCIQEYKDFKTFFPFLPEAAYAQMQVGMAHYRRMEKPDRDRTEAKYAEDEFQAFLLEYPKDKLAPEAEQHLREVQEVLAEGDYRIGHYYYIKGSKRAAFGRLSDLANRYPLYSRADEVNWMLGNIWEGTEQKNLAVPFYTRIVREYPLSRLAGDAKSKLTKLGAPIPQADPVALARMRKEQEIERKHPGMFHKATGILRSTPDVTTAAQTGAPNLTPSGEASPGTETLTPGGTTALGGTGGAAGNSAIVQTVPAGSSSGGTVASQPSTTPNGAGSDGQPPAPKSGATDSPPPSSASAPAASADPAGAGDATKPATSSADASAGSDPKAAKAPCDDKSKSSKAKKDGCKESTSKKKKGMRKVIPW
ncbi:MAG TPA: outer membrane protein assembly factor BamD [Candidatus Acidoferrales bacterium]|nr:outer membrane protein assembly factor BamD [Candidatus Acidoferrales bacterium]